MVYRYHIHMDAFRWLCLFDKRYGSVFQKDHRMGADKNDGGRGSAALYTYRDTKEKNRQTSCGTQRLGKPVCIQAILSIIKREWLDRKVIFDYDHAYELCFEYIETFYNTVRIHSHCGYESPNEYEKNWASDKH